MAMYPTPLQTQDRALRRRVRSTLLQQGISQGVSLSVAGGKVVLRGAVPDQRIRRRMLECCAHVAGVLRVVDETGIKSARASPS